MKKLDTDNILTEPSDDSPISEFQKMSFEEMDFAIVKKILSDQLSEEIKTEPEDAVKDQKILILETKTLEEGLKKAGDLLDLDIREIKYRYIDKVYHEIDGEQIEFNRIEFIKKATTGTSKIAVSQDRLTATLKILFPKKPDGAITSYQDIITLLDNMKISYGIDKEAIENAITKTQENYDVLQNILIAKGDIPTKGENSKIVESIFQDINKITYINTHGHYLQEIFSLESIESIHQKSFPGFFVQKGDMIAKATRPTEGKPGKDIFGKSIPAQTGEKQFVSGDNIKTEVNEKYITYSAEISGYLELENDKLQIQSPLWIKPDFLEAYYIKLPRLNKTFSKAPDNIDFKEQMQDIKISHGIDSLIVDTIPHELISDQFSFKALKVAEGDIPAKGKDSRVEFFFVKDSKPGKLLENGRIDYRETDMVKTVKENQLLAVKYSPTSGIPGKTIFGMVEKAQKGEDITFNTINNVKTVLGKGKILYYSTIEGRVDLVGEAGISVNQMYEVKGNVDFHTGNIDFNGDVNIGGSVNPGFSIRADGNIIVKGMVNQGAQLNAGGNIEIKEGVIGKSDTKLKAIGHVKALYMQGVTVEAESNVIVTDYIINSTIKTHGKVITPSKEKKAIAKGSIIGGDTYAMKGIMANTIGSDVSSNTRIIVGVDFSLITKLKDFKKAVDYCDYEISKISKTLRVGMQDIPKLKETLKKLPPAKQKPFLEAFGSLDGVNKLREDIITKRNELVNSAESLSQNAAIIVRNQLYSRVYVQIGENKMLIDKDYTKLKLREGANRKQIDFVDLKKVSPDKKTS